LCILLSAKDLPAFVPSLDKRPRLILSGYVFPAPILYMLRGLDGVDTRINFDDDTFQSRLVVERWNSYWFPDPNKLRSFLALIVRHTAKQLDGDLYESRGEGSSSSTLNSAGTRHVNNS